jgi:CheY-like chemotaxis protein
VSAAGLVLSDDLVFVSRISATAQAQGLSVRQARTPAELMMLARQNRPAGFILDLQNPGLDLPALLIELRATCVPMPRVMGYGSHVEKQLLQAAREAGCDPVLPRSQFVKLLDSQLLEWLGQTKLS